MISILMPIYNGIEFIEESVESILAQTYKHWELIIAINGHPPNSEIYRIAKYFQCQYPLQIRVLDFYYIQGKANTLNAMIPYCNYDYVALLDVDDIWYPTKLETQSIYLGPNIYHPYYPKTLDYEFKSISTNIEHHTLSYTQYIFDSYGIHFISFPFSFPFPLTPFCIEDGVNEKKCNKEKVKDSTITPFCYAIGDNIWNGIIPIHTIFSGEIEIEEKSKAKAKRVNYYDVIGTQCVYLETDRCDYSPPIPTGDLNDYNFFSCNPIINSSAIIRKEYCYWNENGIEDYDLWLRLKTDCRSFFNCKEVLVKHRIHSASAFNSRGHSVQLAELMHKYSISNSI